MELFGKQKTISVAVPRPMHGLYTYLIPEKFLPEIRLGGWVKIPFGNSVVHGFVVELPKSIEELPSDLPLSSLKEVLEVGTSANCLPSDVLELCWWVHDYYFAPLGEVIKGTSLGADLKPPKLKRGPKALKCQYSGSIEKHTLTEDQASALSFLDDLRRKGEGKIALLKGVTGSGKTEVYSELAKNTLREGKGVIILVPEIALTPQLHQRFEKSLEAPVGLWHSAISDGARMDQLHALKTGELRVLVGARSAIFAPVENLGLIVVDEEHDPTFKQEDRVRYHARDLAVVRGKITKALVVLGSATPSIETRVRVQEGRYQSVELPKRIAAGGMPEIQTVNLCEEEPVENVRSPLAKKTLEAIQQAVDAGEQVIVYLNRRGFAAFLICHSCGSVSNCPSCSISLTLYKKRNELRCHVCGHREPIPEVCHKCKGYELDSVGGGTESLESELAGLVQGAKIIRLDRDQVTSAKRLDQVLDDFRQRKANILLGTQMLVKGHDFPGVTLVVVMTADALFRWPDFRAPERAFQILKQVSGRAGRGEKPGKVLIQAYQVDHPVLQVVLGNMDEEEFLEGEVELRKILGYPPFGRLARQRFESNTRNTAVERAQEVCNAIKVRFNSEMNNSGDQIACNLELLGPSEAMLEKAKGVYRWDLLLKAKNVQTLQRVVSFSRDYCLNKKWHFLVDIDPYGT